MTTIALVLSAGGTPGRAFHAGALAGLAAATSWDARQASLIVGTSAGALAAVELRTGLSPIDAFARFTGGSLSAEGAEIVGRIRSSAPPWEEYRESPVAPFTPTAESRTTDQPARLSLALAARGLVSRRGVRPGLLVAGLSRRSTWSNQRIADRVRDLHGSQWPENPTWICAVRVRDGARIVFGRDDVPHDDIALAVQASSAVPHSVAPVRVGGTDYIDGAMVSTTHADLVAPLAYDAVVIVSSMTAVPDASRCTSRQPTRSWMSAVLAREVAAIRASGTPVLVVQPTAADLAVRTAFSPGAAGVRAVAEQAFRTAQGAVTRSDAARVLAQLERASAVAAG
jgi:NTE family protein